MREKILKLIDTLSINQSEFGNTVGLSSSQVSMFLSGKRELSKTAISSICSKYSINPEWLKNDNVPMFLPESQRSELSPEVFEIAKKLDSLPPEKKSLLTKMIKAGIE